jgi:hypothetical protein
MNAPILCPLFGCIVYFLFRKDSQQRDYIYCIQDLLSWFPNYISRAIANFLVNDVMMIIYIIFAGFIGLCLDSAFSR